MKKFELISDELFANEIISNSQASRIFGGLQEATVYTSSTTGWKYADVMTKDGKKIDFGTIIK